MCWPNAQSWSMLNTTVGGRLMKTVPLGSVCHDSDYDQDECDMLRQSWQGPRIYEDSASAVMMPIAQNQSCDPFTPRSSPCLLGNYVAYSINVSNVDDVAAGISFARKNNIRLVVKNTGHDWLGKSTGKGALGLWTHNLKAIDFLDWHEPTYSGPAVRLGAGVQAYEALAAAERRGLIVIGGSCPTVGLAGGFTSAGGHGMHASVHGLAADHVLQWEVVTADGQHLNATPTENADLYWALSDGGPGTYAVVVSMTTKAFPDNPTSGAKLSFNLTESNKFWKAVDAYHRALPDIVDSGIATQAIITNSSFTLSPVSAPGKSVNAVTRLLRPFMHKLEELGIEHDLQLTEFPTFYKHWSHYLGPLPDGPYTITQITGGRLIPRRIIENDQDNEDLSSVIRHIVDGGEFYYAELGINVSHAVAGNAPGSNSVLPAWREAIGSSIVVGPWDWSIPWHSMLARQAKLTDELMPKLWAVTPNSGTYLNEADWQTAFWKEDFYGANYVKLDTIKRKYDPDGIFYAPTAIGSDSWEVRPDGRLCHKAYGFVQ